MELVWPSYQYLSSYVVALESGWSADNVRGVLAAREELAKIGADPAAFLESMIDREAKAGPVILPDGSTVARIPGYRRWMWDGDFCGSISLRWQVGTTELPAHCLGHIGYAVVPWKRGRGYATLALRMLLVDAKAEGLPYVDITTDPENIASQRVITANGGIPIGQFMKPAQYGSVPGLRFRVPLR